MGFWGTVVSGLVILAVGAILKAIWKNKDVMRRRIKRRVDSIKWLPCRVFNHVEPGFVDYEMGEPYLCERCGEEID